MKSEPKKLLTLYVATLHLTSCFPKLNKAIPSCHLDYICPECRLVLLSLHMVLIGFPGWLLQKCTSTNIAVANPVSSQEVHCFYGLERIGPKAKSGPLQPRLLCPWMNPRV